MSMLWSQEGTRSVFQGFANDLLDSGRSIRRIFSSDWSAAQFIYTEKAACAARSDNLRPCCWLRRTLSFGHVVPHGTWQVARAANMSVKIQHKLRMVRTAADPTSATTVVRIPANVIRLTQMAHHRVKRTVHLIRPMIPATVKSVICLLRR